MTLKPAQRAFHIMSKPIGPKCNLDCKYCFYLEKESLWAKNERYQMDLQLLEKYVKDYIEAQPNDHVNFAWQGGEPTLRGIDFFREVVAFQKKYANGKTIGNALQTNGTLLNDEWASFFMEEDFLIGLSIDGPKKLHDEYRVGKKGQGSWDQVMAGLEILKKHEVEWNSLTCVNRRNSKYPMEVYRFLRGIGSKHMQFIPIVERKPNSEARELNLSHATPAHLDRKLDNEEKCPVTPWSVKPSDHGSFLTSIFDRWVRKDVGRIFIQINEVTLSNWLGRPGGLCIFSETCGDALAMEHDGSFYSCDHFVYPEYKLGNIGENSIVEMLESGFQRKFGMDKRNMLPQQCLDCSVRSLCNGGCPKQRFLEDEHGNPGLNYLCEGYFHYFTHTAPYIEKIAALLNAGRPAADIMEKVK